jgi:hypothetical protein
MNGAMTKFLIGAAVLAQILLAGPAMAADFFVYSVKAKFIVRMVVVDFSQQFDSVVEAKLDEKDVVNLALGRPLGTKVDKKTEILALATAFEGSSGSPLSKLVVFDPTKTGPARITRTVARATSLELESATAGTAVTGQGIATAEIQANGDAEESLNVTAVLLTGSGKAPAPPGPDGTVSLKGAIGGRFSFTTTEGGETTTISGFVVNGKVSASGKSIGQFTE